MKNKFLVTIFIILALIFLLSQPSLGIESTTCKECHGYVKPLDSITKDCSICHNQEDHQDLPSSRDREYVHWRHSQYVYLTQERCTICHQKKPDCTKCHNSHEIVKRDGTQNAKLNVARTNATQTTFNATNISNIADCTNCHGALPTPLGHADFRGALSTSKHQWMNCRTCHINSYITGKGNNFELHFKDLLTVPIDDSIDLCKICHSKQYKELKYGTHGTVDKKCVDCHNPHTTKFGATAKITPKETPVNISSRVESATDWITTKVPILKNTVALIIIFLVIAMTIAEHILTKDEEGKRTAYNTVKIRGNEDKLKTLEIKLKNQNIGLINEILEISDIGVLGMTMTQEEDKDINIYKYVIFVNMDKPIDEKILIDKIVTMDNVKSAIFTEKYEL